MTGFDDISAFNLSLEKFAKVQLPADFKRFRDKIAIQVLRGVVLKTPVITGFARGGWSVFIGNVSAGASLPHRQGKSKSGTGPINDGVRKIGRVKPFAAITISNDRAYIVPLENGSSAQAPNGMLKLTLLEIRLSHGF